MKSITIISTQMQLINAIEAINKFDCKVNYLIVYAASTKRLEQIKFILDNKKYANFFTSIKYFTIDLNRISIIVNIVYFLLFINIKARNKIYDYCIIGNYNYYIHRYVQLMSNKKNKNIKTVLVDDGLSILDYSNSRMLEIINKTVYLYGSKIHKIIIKSINFRSYIPTKLIFFTLYSDLIISNNDTIIANQYIYLISNLESFNLLRQDEKRIYILGQPLIENKIIDKKTYNLYLRNLHNFFSEFSLKRLIYIQHPGENIINSIDDKNTSIFEIVSLPLSFEIFAFSLSSNSIIVGFYSSALINLNRMKFDFKLYSIFINEIDINPEIYKKIKLAYDQIEKDDIKILNMNDENID